MDEEYNDVFGSFLTVSEPHDLDVIVLVIDADLSESVLYSTQ